MLQAAFSYLQLLTNSPVLGSLCTSSALHGMIPPISWRGTHCRYSSEYFSPQGVGISKQLLDRLQPRCLRLPGRLIFNNQVRLSALIIAIHDDISKIVRCATGNRNFRADTIKRVSFFEHEKGKRPSANPFLPIIPVVTFFRGEIVCDPITLDI